MMTIPNTNPRLYVLEITLVEGLGYVPTNHPVSRTVQMLGNQTFDILHRAIFEAFDRFDEHLYEFRFGGTDVYDRNASTIVHPFYYEEMSEEEGVLGAADSLTLDDQHLSVGAQFCYVFDFGDGWVHNIRVKSIEKLVPEGELPRLVDSVGVSPPQYPSDEWSDDNEDELDEDFAWVSTETVEQTSTDLVSAVAEELQARLQEILKLTDQFCEAHLNEEYKQLCRIVALQFCQSEPGVKRGRAESWASGIVYAVGQVNFLTDPSQEPYVKAEEIAKGIGVSVSNMQSKSKVVWNKLSLRPLHPDYCLPSQLTEDPLAWTFEIDGEMVDVRDAPLPVQQAIYDQGLIPYLPGESGA